MSDKIIHIAIVLSVVLLTACGGRTAEPVMVKRQEDEGKNCKILAYDIENIEFQIHQLLPKTDKLKDNVAYGVAGWFFLYVPWLLMDFKNAEAVEYKALRERHQHLADIAKTKGCAVAPQTYPTLEDVKEEYTIYKRLQPDHRLDDMPLEKVDGIKDQPPVVEVKEAPIPQAEAIKKFENSEIEK